MSTQLKGGLGELLVEGRMQETLLNNDALDKRTRIRGIVTMIVAAGGMTVWHSSGRYSCFFSGSGCGPGFFNSLATPTGA